MTHRFTGSAPWARCIFCGVSRESVASPSCDKAIDQESLRTAKDFREFTRAVNTALGSFRKKTLVAKTAPT